MAFIDKRNAERLDLYGFAAHINVANTVIDGTVKDISSLGLSVCDVKRDQMRASHQYTVAVNGKGFNIFIPIKPRWVKISDCGEFLDIGFRILYSPQAWKLLLESILSEELDQVANNASFN